MFKIGKQIIGNKNKPFIIAEVSANHNGSIEQAKKTIIAAKEAGFEEDLVGDLKGQLAVVTGEAEISATAKIVKNFESEFSKPGIRFAYMGDSRLDESQVKIIADLPSLDELRAKIVGVVQAPAQKLATLVNTPGTQLAQVLKAKSEKGDA
mgnify:CR=1 FL=1